MDIDIILNEFASPQEAADQGRLVDELCLVTGSVFDPCPPAL
jgi:hypothetical protein